MDAVLAAAAWNGHTKVRWALQLATAAVVNKKLHPRMRPHVSFILIYMIRRHRFP
jgi:hypothetical protein